MSPSTFAAIVKTGQLPAYQVTPDSVRFLLSDVMAVLVPVAMGTADADTEVA